MKTHRSIQAAFLHFSLAIDQTSAWTTSNNNSKQSLNSNNNLESCTVGVARRTLLTSLVGSVVVPSLLVAPDVSNAAAVRAVGSGEQACQAAGNCLEVGEWDGAVGWGWGGKDRCDAMDPLCGTDGKLRDSAIVGKAVPVVPTVATADNEQVPLRFTHIAAIQIEVGRAEVGVLKLGFYGNQAGGAVQQLVDFLSPTGLTATTVSSSSSNIGVTQPAVSLQTGGVVTGIVPNAIVELGVPSQSNAYARSLGRSKAGDSFVPQPRPPTSAFNGDIFVRSHDCAGLVSVPAKGLGYGGTGFESDDECYESAFLITADAVPALDNNKRRVVGQVLDAESMAFLERLANIPTKRMVNIGHSTQRVRDCVGTELSQRNR